MWANSRCSILFHLEVPGGKWHAVISRPVPRASAASSSFHARPAAAVGAARVGGDQQAPGIGVASGPRRPTTGRSSRPRTRPCRGRRRRSTQPVVRGQVVDPVRDRLAQLLVREVVILDQDRIAGGPPFTAAVAAVADQFLLLGVDADHRLPGVAVLPGLLVQVPELGVPVRDLVPLDGLRVALQAEALFTQQVSHRVRADAVALAGELGGQRPQRFRRPPQRRHRITPLIGLHQRQQRRPQPQIQVSQPLRPPPSRRTLPSGSSPRSSSAAPRDTVASRTSAARATIRIPPCPRTRASAPISSRRCRSSRCGKIAPNFAASISAVTSAMPYRIPQPRVETREPTGYLSTSPKSVITNTPRTFPDHDPLGHDRQHEQAGHRGIHSNLAR